VKFPQCVEPQAERADFGDSRFTPPLCITAHTLTARRFEDIAPDREKDVKFPLRIGCSRKVGPARNDATHAAAEATFGTEELVALVARIGSFSMTCCTANAFDITPPDDAPARLKA
jgi:hypothetical protein